MVQINRNHGRIALVGSGEYLPAMSEFERELLDLGGSDLFIQIPTAAGQESSNRLEFWRELGAEQAKRIGAKQVFLPIYTREDAFKKEFADQINGAGLIYLSGGDPHYLASTIIGSPVYDAIIENWQRGTSLAGCSAGAMALGPDIPHFRKMKEDGDPGFGIVSNIRTIPHFNKFFKWIPESAAQRFMMAPNEISIIGIDELTAIFSDDLLNWNVFGIGKVHILHGRSTGTFNAHENFEI